MIQLKRKFQNCDLKDSRMNGKSVSWEIYLKILLVEELRRHQRGRDHGGGRHVLYLREGLLPHRPLVGHHHRHDHWLRGRHPQDRHRAGRRHHPNAAGDRLHRDNDRDDHRVLRQ